MKRVVVTGMGIVCPTGLNLQECWENIIAGKSGISKVENINLGECPVKIAGSIPNFEAKNYMDEKDVRRSQRYTHLAIAAAQMAIQDASLKIGTDYLAADVGVSLGVGVGGLDYLEEQIFNMLNKGYRSISPFMIPGFIANMAAGWVSITTGAAGPNICTTTACTSGTHAIGEAWLQIRSGMAKAVIAGGAEACLSQIAFSGFARMKALTQDHAGEPHRASRPFDKNRSGFVMGEGSGVLILEDLESALNRNARIYAELSGYGMSGDAFHMTSPQPQGEGAIRCMTQALQTANWDKESVDYINAHGTSTEMNDKIETLALKTLFGDHAHKLKISSTKSMTGHLLGAAGGIEAVFTAMSLVHGEIPPTINLENPDPECDLNYIPNKSQKADIKRALSNSFGFGGTNATLAFEKYS